MKTDIARITVNVEEDMKKMSGESEVHKSNIVRLQDEINTRFTKFNNKYETGVKRLDKDMQFLKNYT